jgi:hypothetical protein
MLVKVARCMHGMLVKVHIYQADQPEDHTPHQ